MNEVELVKILAELGHRTRLSVYKFIMKFGNSDKYFEVTARLSLLESSSSKSTPLP